MSFALNEVEAMARKAARGAQFSWGMAEEAGKATRWLCAQGFDGCSALALVLAKSEGVEKADMAPTSSGEVWRAPKGPLCPLMAGVALSDFAYLLENSEVSMENVACPNLLLPSVAAAARRLEITLTLDMDGVMIVTDGRDVCLARAGELPIPNQAAIVRVYRGGALRQAEPHHKIGRAHV